MTELSDAEGMLSRPSDALTPNYLLSFLRDAGLIIARPGPRPGPGPTAPCSVTRFIFSRERYWAPPTTISSILSRPCGVSHYSEVRLAPE